MSEKASLQIWRIGVDTPTYEAHDMQGEGARISGGRWNRKGHPMVYAASSRALACLETVVHLQSGSLPLNSYLVEITLPESLWQAATVLQHDSLIGWDALPPGKVSLDWGDNWLAQQQSAIALVPSIVIPEEYCVLLNPEHPDSRQISAKKIRRWLYDHRIKT
ncbi:RES family NAD+ phosphorylase [Alcaligenes endophyticus]|uniref:RES family NAD+ phosphorylase n=1 Tax=Alcaligenes endophyticus TaxID=1929088 RepID=A0ABT8EK05_9BURK|nr:RES family NAD+ phosphorylase [Alcaligenes endophyticus]MCX5591930.1 RES family NAD+ phosphorylase [Alcaligenes endophyticus]MDN4121620.1 RES family NAD+ phosphorylase [Alcaligenes endophyticus]